MNARQTNKYYVGTKLLTSADYVGTGDISEWDDLLKKLIGAGITVTEIHGHGPGVMNVRCNSPQEFYDFICGSGIKFVFFERLWVDPQAVMIEDYPSWQYNEFVIEAIQDQIESYNDDVCKRSELAGEAIVVFTIVGTNSIGIVLTDDITAELMMTNPDATMQKIVEDNEEKINEADEKREKWVEELKAELKQIIIADAEFRACKTKTARKTYASMLSRMDKYRKFRPAFQDSNGFTYLQYYVQFVEGVWAELEK